MALRIWIRRVPRSNQIRSTSTAAEPPVPPAKNKYIPTSGTYPKGFLAGSAHARVKPANTKYNDVALVVSEQPCTAAAVFTRNVFKAAPVTVSDAILQKRSEGFRGVVVNSGFANAVTGSAGTTHAWDMAKAADRCFGDAAAHIPQTLVMSTGIIGQQLPIDRITAAIPKAHAALGTGHIDWLNAARAICTTDTFPKLVSRKFTLPSDPNTEYRLAGMTKGAGMIHPNMGTLLGIVCTDAKIAAPDIHTVLRHATDQSFNCISVDGDTSTNDTVAFFANGAATSHPDTPALTFPSNTGSSALDLSALSPDSRAFAQILTTFMTDLAHLVVRDGEGATKFVTVRVRSATSAVAARRAAASIATSALVKTALYGRDANWGRILCAIGYAPGVAAGPLSDIVADSADHVRPSCTTVAFVPADGSPALALLVRGEPQDVDETRAKEILEMEDLEILVRLDDDGTGTDAEGGFEAKYWTCDFSHEYVTINGDYRT